MKSLRQLPVSIVLLLLLSMGIAQAADIIVDASQAGAQVSQKLLGYNLSYFRAPDNYTMWHHTPAEDLWAWDVYETTPAWEPRAAVPAIVQAATGTGALVRFPAGDNSDRYHWRRGIGWPLDTGDGEDGTGGGKRPYDVDPWHANKVYGNEFGTDELMAFIGGVGGVGHSSKPLITVNWWDFNRPGRPSPQDDPHHQPQSGIQEAANWVEYCNGIIDQHLINQAISGSWVPSQFRDQAGVESTDVTAVEWADSWKDAESPPLPRTCWRSWEDAPDGYFAWLRRYFEWKRPTAYGGKGEASYNSQPLWKSLSQWPDHTYNITYWQIGNEPAWQWNSKSSATYQQHAQAYCASVNAYADAMKAVDPNIKIGACLEDRANMWVWTGSTVTPTNHLDGNGDLVPLDDDSLEAWTGGNWDTLLLAETGDNIDYVTVHPYAGAGTDPRYSISTYSSDNPTPDAKYQHVTLDSSKTYTFWVRAKGAHDSGQDAPRISFYLIPCSNPSLGCTNLTITGAKKLYVAESYPAVQEVEVGGDMTAAGSDYAFRVVTTDPVQSAAYIPWVRLENAGGGREIQVQTVYYSEGDVAPGDPDPEEINLMEFRKADDQTEATFAQTVILGRRLKQIRDYMNNPLHPYDLELGCTEYAYYPKLTARPDQIRSLKGVMASADLLKEMMLNGVSFACYSGLHSWYTQIAQSEGTYDFLDNYEPDADPDVFFPSPQANLMKLLVGHWGTDLLATSTPSAATFASPAYERIVAVSATPYASAVASGGGEANGYYHKVYVLVMNKDWATDREWTISLSGLHNDIRGIAWHTLKCWDGTVADPLDAQNTSTDPDKVSFWSASEPAPTYANPMSITHVFPAGSVTVLEITIGETAPIYSIGHSLTLASGSVDFGNKYVTAKFGNKFYIEEPLRTAGIGVECTGTVPTALVVGSKVSLTGTLGTDEGDGEREVTVDADDLSVAPGVELGPLGMRNEWLAGSPTGSNPTIPVTGFGLYNVGLLVQSWGRVTDIDPGDQWFYIDDGSNVYDSSEEYRAGTRVLTPSGFSPVLDRYYRITGISGAAEVGSYVIPLLRPRSGGDIEWIGDSSWVTDELEDSLSTDSTNFVTLPGIPRYPGPEYVFQANPGITLSGKLARWDAKWYSTWVTYQDCGESLFGNCLVADAFELPIPSAGPTGYHYDRKPLEVDQWISLPYGSDPMGELSVIGHPFTNDVSWAACKVTDGVSLMNLPDAVSSSWIHAVYKWSGTAWQEVDDLSTGSMLTGKAYEFYPARDSLALIVPYQGQ